MYFNGMLAAVQGETPLLNAEMPATNGAVTARALARIYGAIANHGEIDGNQFLSQDLVAGLTSQRDLRLDRNLLIPISFHLGYHSVPFGLWCQASVTSGWAARSAGPGRSLDWPNIHVRAQPGAVTVYVDRP
jgi:hypothetical protein